MARKVGLEFLDREAAFLQAAMAFANHRKKDGEHGFDDAQQVYDLFDPFGAFSVADGSRQVARLKETGEEGAAIFGEDQTEMRGNLQIIAKGSRREKEKLAAELDAMCEKKGAFVIPSISRGRLQFRVQGVEGAYFLALAILLDRSRAGVLPLRVCGLEECKNFYVASSTKKGGARSFGCSPSHREMIRRLESVRRSKEWRIKKAQEK